MSGVPPTAWLANIRLHPIKGLDPVSVPEARIGPNGGLELDRVWVLFSVDGAWINGKRTAAIHHIRAEYDPGVSMVTLMVSGGVAKKNKLKPTSFAFPSDYERAAAWFSEYFEQTVIVRHVPEVVPDDGPATQSPHRRRPRRLPEKVQRNAPQFPASVIAHRPLRSFLSPGHQHARPVHGTGQIVTYWRRPGAVKIALTLDFTVSNERDEPDSIFSLFV